LSFAMVQGAVYDAVNAIDRGHRPYLVEPPARRSDSEDAAAARAAFVVLDKLFGLQQHDTLQSHYDATLAGLRDAPRGSVARGAAVGEAAAQAMLAARANDGRGGSFSPVGGSAPGAWRPLTPTAIDPAPWVAFVRPFLVGDVERLRTDPPNALTSRAYARDFNEIKSFGALHSTTRTTDETDAAIYWQDHLHAFWNRVFRTLATSRHLRIADSARLFAMTNLAGADAAIGCWNNKYHWNFWRPITAIHEAGSDGNPLTEADTQWTPLFSATTPVASGQAPLVTPPFPDHPSGHTCGTSAFVHTLQAFFGSDRVPFTAVSNKNGMTRSYARLSDALQEVIDARVWAGIHFRTADEAGAELGAKVARYARLMCAATRPASASATPARNAPRYPSAWPAVSRVA
jgi:hypothetical protein